MNNDIRKIVEENWEDIKALVIEKAEQKLKPKTIWDLSVGDNAEYYRLYSEGDVAKLSFDCYYDEKSREAGNAFLTEEEAKFELERRKIEAVMREYSQPFTPGFGDWYICYNYGSGDIYFDYIYNVDYGIPYFETREVAQKVVDRIGKDRLKKYWFGVTK